MLKQRVVTALVLAAVVIAVLSVASPWPFIVLGLLAVAAAGWEWVRLNPPSTSAGADAFQAVFGGVLGAWCVGLLHFNGLQPLPRAFWVAVMVAWAFAGTLLLLFGVQGWRKLPRWLRLCIGLLVLGVAFAALVQARVQGVNFLVSCMALVFAADIAAYFAGRALGGKIIARKLAPGISPGKTWEGAIGGAVGVLALAAIWIAVDRSWGQANPWSQSLYSLLLAQGGVAYLVFWALVLTALSVVGDLFESLVKRAAGAKDSSQLLPGHGGVLDRIDAQLPVLPAALAIVTFAGGMV